MDVLIRGLDSLLRRDGIILVRRIPPTKTLRAHLFGLTLGLVGAFFIIVLDHPALFGGMAWYTSLAAVAIFVIGAWLGGPFVILTALAFLFAGKNPPEPPAFFSSLVIIGAWHFAFYAIGAVFSILYNLLVFFNLITFGKKQIKIAFAYDPKRAINIVKSPIAKEEKAFVQLENAAGTTKKKEELRSRKLYHYHLHTPPARPYTIALVANPKILRLGERYESDPIIKDVDLFLRAVHHALHSLELDEVVGQHQIFSRIRVVAIFDDAHLRGSPVSDNDLSLIQDFYADFTTNNNVADVLSIARAEMVDNVREMLTRHQGDLLPDALTIDDIDVIFALTASPILIRPTSYYADFNETLNQQQNPNSGRNFLYNADPSTDPSRQKGNAIVPVNCGLSPFACQHDHNSHRPGRAAINVLSARRHTYIHEFAHAMSSAVRGAICDEYYDESFLLTRGGFRFKPFYVNRIERVQGFGGAGRFAPVHQIFAQYEDEVYLSDVAHPSAAEEWMGYFPEREQGQTCTMDRTAEPFKFDKLIRRFIYDRLVTKSNR